MGLFKRILVVDRPTQYSSEALRNGVKLARTFGAELSILRLVANPVDLEAVNAPGLFIKGEEYKNYQSMHQQYAEDLEKLTRQYIVEGIPIRQFVSDHDSIKEIQRLVQEHDIDLIVTLAYEEGRLEHLLFGGERDALVRTLPCSVLFIKREPTGVE